MCNICLNVTQFVWQLTMILESYIFRFCLCCADGNSYHMNRNFEKEKTNTHYNVMIREWELGKEVKQSKKRTHTHTKETKQISNGISAGNNNDNNEKCTLCNNDK